MNYLYYADFESGSVMARSFKELQEKLEKKFPPLYFSGVCGAYMLETKNEYTTTLDRVGWFMEFGHRTPELKIYDYRITVGRMASQKTALGDFNLIPATSRTTCLFPIFTKHKVYKKIWWYFVLIREDMVLRITADSIELLHGSNAQARKYYYPDEYTEATYEEVLQAANKVLRSAKELLKEPITVLWRWNCWLDKRHYVQTAKGFIELAGGSVRVHAENTFTVEEKNIGTGEYKYSPGRLVDAALILDHFTSTVARLVQNPNRRYEDWESASRKEKI